MFRIPRSTLYLLLGILPLCFNIIDLLHDSFNLTFFLIALAMAIIFIPLGIHQLLKDAGRLF